MGMPVADDAGDLLRVVAADDEPFALQRLVSALASLSDVQVVATATEGHGAIAEVKRLLPDVVILDVEMPGADGLEVATRIERENGPEVIILSAFDGYAVDAFAVEAVDYLIKPFRQERLAQALDRARRRRRERAAHDSERERLTKRRATATIHIPGRHGGYHLAVNEIIWIEAARDYALLHTCTRTHILRVTMTALTRELPPTMLRVHRSAFVALDHVARWGAPVRGIHSLILSDGAEVTVGASYYDQVAATLRGQTST